MGTGNNPWDTFMRRRFSFSVIPAALSLAACSGSGVGLDTNGRPTQTPDGPLIAEFSSIQTHVFTPICTQCHEGAAAPLGLRLDEASAYAALINAPSVEEPSLKRVDPGNPSGSYLLQKIAGLAAVGGRMPLGQPALPDDAIAAIRQWILEGAAPPVAAATSGAAAPRVAAVAPSTAASVLTAVFPQDGDVLSAPPAALLIAASDEIDTTTLGAGISLVRSGRDGGFAEGNEVLLTDFTIEIRSIAPTVFAITPATGQWTIDTYRLKVAGSGINPVRDRAGAPIDGDADGRPGGDFILTFTLQGAP